MSSLGSSDLISACVLHECTRCTYSTLFNCGWQGWGRMQLLKHPDVGGVWKGSGEFLVCGSVGVSATGTGSRQGVDRCIFSWNDKTKGWHQRRGLSSLILFQWQRLTWYRWTTYLTMYLTSRDVESAYTIIWVCSHFQKDSCDFYFKAK